jgi:hypothetical protein
MQALPSHRSSVVAQSEERWAHMRFSSLWLPRGPWIETRRRYKLIFAGVTPRIQPSVSSSVPEHPALPVAMPGRVQAYLMSDVWSIVCRSDV